MERNDCDFNLAIRKPELPDDAEAQSQREKIIAASRAKYATPRAEVEAALLARIWGDKPAPPQPEAPRAPEVSPALATPVSEPPQVAEAQKAAEVRKAEAGANPK